jgi:hypothetical protein
MTGGMDENEIYAGLRYHVAQFFRGHKQEETVWTVGPGPERLPRLRILRVSPGPKIALWTYVSIGAWEASAEHGTLLEFFILAPTEDVRHVELLTMTACYQQSSALGIGHTLPIGEPWLHGSLCDHLLISRPYPFGPEFQICCLPNDHAHFCWLLPISEGEREFKIQNGLEQLEQRFDNAGLEYWDVTRPSVV